MISLLDGLRLYYKVKNPAEMEEMWGTQQGKFITIYPYSAEHASIIAFLINEILKKKVQDRLLERNTDFVDFPSFDRLLGLTQGLSTRFESG